MYALVITDDCTGYRWLYGLKTKDDILKAIRKWYSDIAELRDMRNLLVVMRDNAGENRSREIIEFFESRGIRSYFSTPYEQWQNGQGESSINSLMTLARCDIQGAYQMTPRMQMYGAKKDIYKFRAFGCQAYMYLDSERRANGKHIPRAIEAINLGFATDHNISGYTLFI